MRKTVLAFAVALLAPSPAFSQTTCADAYALCMSPCGNEKSQAPERCMQSCRGKRDVCMTTGTLQTGHQSFKGLQRVLEESPAISAWDVPSEPPQTLRKNSAAQPPVRRNGR